MRLERLEISGFKSFSDRSELAFDEGVTAIVGPNGCGKSNVADAITWVLGEQSAKSLRGERMEDVIFNGSDARRPGAAAEVRLRLTGLAVPANGTNGNGSGHPSDVDETILEQARAFTRDVDVTRRLYRSGESEYLIDGEVCRLRDVHELLMDTGLGAKAYAIIEQGKIGMILSSRPTDRRQLIEEAAGITQVQVPPPCRRAQARSGPAEPHPHRRHRLRGRQAARHAEAAGREGTPVQEAARGTAALGEGAVRAAVSRAGAQHRRRRAPAWRRRASVSPRRPAAWRRSKPISAVCASSRPRPITARRGIREDGARARARHQPPAAAAGVQPSPDRDAGIARNRHRTTRSAISRRGASPPRIALESRREAAAEAERARDEAAGVLSEASEAHARAQQQIEGLEIDVESARADGFSALNSRDRIAPRDGACGRAARARGRDAWQARRRAGRPAPRSREGRIRACRSPPSRTLGREIRSSA